MYKFLISALLLTALSAQANTLNKKDLEGIWLIQLAVSGPYFVAEIQINSENGTYTYRDTSTGGTMPEPGCQGRFDLTGKTFKGELDCSAIGGPKIVKHTADFSKLNTQNPYSDSEVTISSSVMDNIPMPYKIRKLHQPYFPKNDDKAAECHTGWERVNSCFPKKEAGDDEMVAKLYDAISICYRDGKSALALRAADNTQMISAKREIRSGGITFTISEPRIVLSRSAGMGPGRGDKRASLYLKNGRKLLRAGYTCK